MIFCVEDDSNIRELVVYTLETTGFKARGFEDGREFLEALALETPELVLMDIMLPGDDGLELLKKLKASPKTREIPVIMVTAKGAEYDKVKGLDLGADDYVTKPFNPLELMARVKSQLRRYRDLNPANEKKGAEDSTIRLNHVTIIKETHQVFVDGESIKLTPIEFDILYLLASHPGRVFSTDEIFEKVWNEKVYEANNTVMVHIRRLRGKMKDDTRTDKIITTVWGVGYKIEQ